MRVIMQETLKEGILAQKLMELSEQEKNGILTIEYNKVRKIISFEEGKIRYATSNVRNEALLEYLIESKKIDKNKTASIPKEPGISLKIVQHISSLGLISEEEAIQEARDLIIKIIKSCFKMHGQFSIKEGIVNLSGKVTVQLSPQDIILDYYRNDATALECKTILGKETSMLIHASDALQKMAAIPFNNLEKDILKMVDGQTKMCDLLKIFPSTSDNTLRGLTNLCLFKTIEIEGREDKQATSDHPKDSVQMPPAETTVPEEDLEEQKHYRKLFEKHARSNYFQLLGVQRYSGIEEIQKNYYALAKELHPDRFQKEAMKEIKPLMENLFSRISEAYEVLSNEEKRKAYEEELFEEVKAKTKVLEERQDNVTTARGNFLMGKKFFLEAKYSDACKFFENAVNLDGTRWEYYFHLAMTQSKNPRFRAQAIYNFKKSISMNPANAEAYLHLGILYKKSNKMSEARNMLKCALQWDPENSQALNELKEAEKLFAQR